MHLHVVEYRGGADHGDSRTRGAQLTGDDRVLHGEAMHRGEIDGRRLIKVLSEERRARDVLRVQA